LGWFFPGLYVGFRWQTAAATDPGRILRAYAGGNIRARGEENTRRPFDGPAEPRARAAGLNGPGRKLMDA